MANYADIDETDSYFSDEVMFRDEWDEVPNSIKLKALTNATFIINQLNYLGQKTDSAQTNEFPRGTDASVPDNIKKACMEIAYSLTQGVDPDREIEVLSVVGQRYGPTSINYDRDNPPLYILAGVPSPVAWRLLSPYLRDIKSIRLIRVS